MMTFPQNEAETAITPDIDLLIGGGGRTGLLRQLRDRMVELIRAEYPGMKVRGAQPVCFYCEKPLSWESRWSSADNVAVKEHIFAKAKGGTNRKHNLVWACRKCNVEKGLIHLLDWLSANHDIDDMTAMELIARLMLEYYFQIVTLSELRKKLDAHKQQLLALAQTISEELGNGWSEDDHYSDS